MAEQPRTVQDVRRLVDEHGIEFIFASFTEVKGKSSAKLVPSAYLEEIFAEGAGFAGFAAGDIGQGPHSPDVEAVPDPASFRVVPWKPGLGHVVGDARVEGREWPYCPRTILRRQLKKAEERGYVFKVGFEAEFMLVNFDKDGNLAVADKFDNWPRPCYDVKGLTRQYDLITTLSKYITQLGWENYAVDHEDGNGQFECNVTYADALTTADRSVFFRYMTETLAQEAGSIATFMPKPFTNNTGNGFHFTMSLWDAETDTNLFSDPHDPRGFGLSELAYHFLGGLLDHAKGYTAMVAPTVNSYKRLKRGTEAVRTWVPVCITYGGNNRTQMLRIAQSGAIEDRTPDFSGSPYLGMTAALAAGLDGIERQLDPGPPNMENLYDYSSAQLAARGVEMLPANLLEAVDHLLRDDVLREAFGKVNGEDFVDYYARMKRDEHYQVTDIVTDYEIEKYLLFP